MLRSQVLLVSSGLVMVSAIGAQETRGSIAISGGRGTDVAGMSSSAVTVAPSLTSVGPTQSFSLSASGARFSNSAWSASATASFQARASQASVAPTIDLGGTAGLSSYSFSYQMGEATPALEGRWGNLRVFGGAHLVAASSSRSLDSERPLGSVVPSASGGTSATGVAGVGGATITVAQTDGPNVLLSYRSEAGQVAGGWQSDNTFGGTVSNDQVAVSGAIGLRRSVDGSTGFGSAALTLGITKAFAFQVTGGSYPANRLLRIPAGQYVNVGAVMQLSAARPSLPQPVGVPGAGQGMTRLSIRADDAATVEVAGEFNHWEFVNARRAANGVWFADLRIPPGQYRYAFRINGKEWRIPEGAPAAEDEFGGKSAWLTVDRTARAGSPESSQEERQ